MIAPTDPFAGGYGWRIVSGDHDIVSTGWLRVLPPPALEAYVGIWRLAHSEDGPVAGDLDQLDLGLDGYGGLDAPYDPQQEEEDQGEDSTWGTRWEHWCGFAAERGRPMVTCRHVIEFMAEIGMLERRVDGDTIYWSPPSQVPLVEDVLPLSGERREEEARLRWRDAFQEANNAITRWLVEQRTEEELVLEVETSISDLAVELDLDLENARHGLACAVTEASDMWATPDPETALLTASIRITVDWQRFDAERISVRLSLPDDDF
ncbi:MAG TPA: DUF6042 family protein [Solirubrobacterales bacterium]|nr:DUF6042 family protein [Solirubrobacterales bacterium]